VAAITDAAVRDFLSAGTRTGKVAFTAADGRPLIAPVWFVVEGGEILFTTHKDSAKGRALARDPRVALCVDVQAPPYAFVQVQGRAELSDDLAEVVRVATAVGGRYMGADQAEAFGKRNGVPGEFLVRVTPAKVLANFDVTGL
jgi:PPOX class probable F420-dependent enzyme